MGVFDDIDSGPGQFQDSGGMLGRLLSWLPQASTSQPGSALGNSTEPLSADAGNSQPAPPDFGTRLGAGLQSWAQTPVGSPFAALANGIKGFNNTQPVNSVGASPSAPQTATAVTQTPDFGDRLGAAFQSWALTPVGNPFAGLANGINGFNTGQTRIAPTTAKPSQTVVSTGSDQANAAVQNPGAPAASTAMNPQIRQLVALRRRR